MDSYIPPDKNEIKILYPPSGTPEACRIVHRVLIGEAVLDNRFLKGFIE